jgi:hypothetical protein
MISRIYSSFLLMDRPRPLFGMVSAIEDGEFKKEMAGE